MNCIALRNIFIPVRSLILIAEMNLMYEYLFIYDCHTMSVDSFVTNMCVAGDQKLPGNMLFKTVCLGLLSTASRVAQLE